MTAFTMTEIIRNLDRATLITKGLGVEKRGMYVQLALFLATECNVDLSDRMAIHNCLVRMANEEGLEGYGRRLNAIKTGVQRAAGYYIKREKTANGDTITSIVEDVARHNKEVKQDAQFSTDVLAKYMATVKAYAESLGK